MTHEQLKYYTLTKGAHYEITHADQFVIKPVMPEYPITLWEGLQEDCLPPWLLTPKDITQKLATDYSDGQLFIFGPNNKVVGGLLSKKINWSGFEGDLYGLNSVKDIPHLQDGDTLVVTDLAVKQKSSSFDVSLDHMTECLLQYACDTAKKEGVSKMLVSIPAIGLWYTHGLHEQKFALYMRSQKKMYGPRGGYAYIDHNIQKYWMSGYSVVSDDFGAIVEHADMSEFEGYKKIYHPDSWIEVQPNIWHCTQTSGVWHLSNDSEGILSPSAMYEEPHIWMGKAVL